MTATAYQVGMLVGGTQYWFPYEEHEWVDEGGYSAPIVAWIMPKSYATAILAGLAGLTGAAREVTLQLGDPSDLTHYLTVQRVVVIGTAPADNPQKCYLLLSDVRWYFTRAWMALDGNLRRRVGEKYLSGNTLLAATPADVVKYAPWAINNGTAYTWTTFKDQVLAYLTGARHGRPAITFVTDTFSVVNIAGQVIQETSTDGSASVGIARAIESVPGASIRVGLDGVIHVYECTPSAEIPFMSATMAPPVPREGHGDAILVDRSGTRASQYRVYTDYEMELRLTYNASGVGLWGMVNSTDPYLIPVIRVTDQSLTIPAGTYFGIGTVGARTVGQGSWIGQDEAFAAWGAPPGAAYIATLAAVTKITDAMVALHWFDGAIENQLPLGVGGVPDPVWVARLQELRRAYRTFFRVNPKAWDRIRQAWTVRAGIFDPATGTRAMSPVYCNYNTVPVVPDCVNGVVAAFTDLSKNVTTSYDNATGLLVNCKPSGFELVMADSELGIFMINRNVMHKFPTEAEIQVSDCVAPANMDGSPGADEVPGQALRPADSGSVTDWKLATVISVAPAAPNDLRRLYEVIALTGDVATTAGLSGFAASCYGPDTEMRTQLGQARVAWQDDTGVSDVILATLAFADSPIGITSNEPVSFATVNAGVTTPTGVTPINLAQEVVPLCLATAATDLLGKLDCYVGTVAVRGGPANKPIGSLQRVVHRLTEDRFVSILHCVETDQHPHKAADFLSGPARSYLLQTLVTQR